MFFFMYIFKQLLRTDNLNHVQPKVIRELDEIGIARRALQIQQVTKR